MDATFDTNKHTVRPGWATYHNPPRLGSRLNRVLCRLFGHRFPPPPEKPNGYSPSEVTRCRRCDNWAKWYVAGQHRYGGMNRERKP